jgi:WD40 repeat protein
VTPELAPGRALDSGPATPRALCFDRTGARLFVRDERGSLTIYAYEGAALRSVDPADETVTLACSPDGELVALGTAAGEVSLFAASTGQHESARHVGEAAVSALQFSPDGTQLAVGLENATIVSLELESGRQRVLSGHEGIVTCLAFSPDGKRLASGSSDRTLRIWDPENTAALLSLVGHTGAITAVAFDPAGSVLASSAQDGSVRLWQSAAARELR